MRQKKFLTLKEVLDELDVGRSTFNRWMQLGEAPPCTRLPGGQLRFRRDRLDAWIAERTDGEGAAA